MKYFDIKPEPRTRLAEWHRWCNWTVVRLHQCMFMVDKRIKVVVADNDEDWEFVFIDKGNGVKGMAVF